MKKNIAMILVLALVLTLSLPAMADDRDDNVLRINGTATVSLVADVATLYIGTNIREKTVAQAQKKNAAIMDKVVAAIQKAGVPKEDIITSQYNVQHITDPYASESNQYDVSNMLFITIKNLSLVSQVIDSATNAGANNIYGLEFSSSKANEAYQKAMKLAVENAKANAETLAEASGRALGDIVRIEDAGFYHGAYGLTNNTDMMAKEAMGSAIITGDVSVTASVIMEYALRPAPLMK